MIGLWWGGAPALADCPSPNVEGTAIAAVEAVIEDEYAQARSDLETVLETLECLDRLVDPISLVTLWQARAAMAYFDGESAFVSRDLRQAAAMHGEFFEDRLGGDLRAVWEHEVSRDVGLAWVQVHLEHRRQVLWVDGVVRPGHLVDVRPGLHLVQVVDSDRVKLTRFLDVREGETASLSLREHAEGARSGVLRVVEAGAAGGAGLAWVVAVVLDRQSYQVSNVEMHDRLWSMARSARTVSVGLAGATVLVWGGRRLEARH